MNDKNNSIPLIGFLIILLFQFFREYKRIWDLLGSKFLVISYVVLAVGLFYFVGKLNYFKNVQLWVKDSSKKTAILPTVILFVIFFALLIGFISVALYQP